MPEFITLGHDGILYDSEEKEAVLFMFNKEDNAQHWIPRVLLGEYDGEEVEVAYWFAEKNELEGYEI